MPELKPPMKVDAVRIGAWLSGLMLLGMHYAQAHHSFAAEFDALQPINFKGTVARMQWTNPHVWIHIDVDQPDGSVERWAIEAGTPNVLFRRGFTKDSLLPGTEIIVDGYRAKDGSRRANGRDLTFADGRTLFLGSPNAQ